MAIKTRSRLSVPPAQKPAQKPVHPLRRHLPAWVLLVIALLIVAPYWLNTGLRAAGQALATLPHLLQGWLSPGSIAPLFTPEIHRWAGDIDRWASAADLDPNLVATVMQIESCGHPTISSSAGAQGLFQVMPFHFSAGEDMLDTETNARRGVDFLKWCMNYTGGDPDRALACYNGGPGVLNREPGAWPAETQRYLRWGSGIYADARAGAARSSTLDQWLAAGGGTLCQWAASAQG